MRTGVELWAGGLGMTGARQAARAHADGFTARVLDDASDSELAPIVAAAANALSVPLGALSFPDGDRVAFRARFGLELASLARDAACCGAVIASGELLVVEDLARDARFATCDFVVSAPRARFYAGAPLRTRDGSVVGALAVMDLAPRALGARERAVLVSMAEVAAHQIEASHRLAVQHAVLDSAPGMLAYWDTNQRCHSANAAYRKWFGVDPEAMIGTTMKELLGPLYALNLPYIEAVLRGEPQLFERTIPDPLGGPPRFSQAHYVPHVVGGEVRGFCVLVSDITETRRAADERFRSALDAAPNALLLVDPQGAVRHANRAASLLFGYTPGELAGLSIAELVPARFAAAHASHLEAFFANPEARSMGAGRALFAARRDGAEVPVEIGLNPIRTPDGLFTLAAIVDLTEQKRAVALRERLAAIVESSEDAILGAGLDGRISSWNRGAERLLGWSADEAIGQEGLRILVPPDLVDEARSVIARVRAGEAIASFETRRIRRDGAEIPVSATVSPLRGASGEIEGLAAILRDIREQKERDAELRRSNAELEQFAYVASHDLQEPLRMVANYTELLAQRYQGKLDEAADKYIFYASDGARRMQRLVADLLAYSRVGSQGKPIVEVETSAVVANVIGRLRVLVEETGATFDIGALPAVQADEVQLGQLFQNLLANAIKFRAEAAPHVVVRATTRGRFVHFSVQDNGIGFEMQYADRIFLMFQRLHARGTYEGSGIGLAIAKRIVERHGGRIRVESSPGAGTTFHFTLLAARGAP